MRPWCQRDDPDQDRTIAPCSGQVDVEHGKALLATLREALNALPIQQQVCAQVCARLWKQSSSLHSSACGWNGEGCMHGHESHRSKHRGRRCVDGSAHHWRQSNHFLHPRPATPFSSPRSRRLDTFEASLFDDDESGSQAPRYTSRKVRSSHHVFDLAPPLSSPLCETLAECMPRSRVEQCSRCRYRDFVTRLFFSFPGAFAMMVMAHLCVHKCIRYTLMLTIVTFYAPPVSPVWHECIRYTLMLTTVTPCVCTRVSPIHVRTSLSPIHVHLSPLYMFV